MARVFRHTREKIVKKIKKQTIASIKNWHHSLYYIGKKTVTGNWCFQPFLCHWAFSPNSTVLSVVFVSFHLLTAVCSRAFSVKECNWLGCSEIKYIGHKIHAKQLLLLFFKHDRYHSCWFVHAFKSIFVYFYVSSQEPVLPNGSWVNQSMPGGRLASLAGFFSSFYPEHIL